MYKIIASHKREGAILRKENGELYYSSLRLPVREEWLQGFRQGEVEVFVERDDFVLHSPPTLVEKFEDWPKAAANYEAAHKRTQDQQDQDAVHAVVP